MTNRPIRNQNTPIQGILITGVAVLASVLFTACGGPNTSTSSSAVRLSFEEASDVLDQLIPYITGISKAGTALGVTALKHPDNPSEAELSQATGWTVGLQEYSGPTDPDPQHPWAEYDQPVTADGMHFATTKWSEADPSYAETGGLVGNKPLGKVVNVNGCLTLDGKVIPVFGEWKSVAPSLRAGDKIEGVDRGSVIFPEEIITPDECTNTGITEYSSIEEIVSVT